MNNLQKAAIEFEQAQFYGIEEYPLTTLRFMAARATFGFLNCHDSWQQEAHYGPQLFASWSSSGGICLQDEHGNIVEFFKEQLANELERVDAIYGGPTTPKTEDAFAEACWL
jgi:hypothetical protein